MADLNFEADGAKLWETSTIADTIPESTAAERDNGEQIEDETVHTPEVKNRRIPPRRRALDPSLKQSTGWSKSSGLVKNRDRVKKENEAAIQQEHKSYLSLAGNPDQYPIIGYYLWPSELTPFKLFGETLQKLDELKTTHKVIIDWDSALECLRFCSRDSTTGSQNVQEAIKGTQQALKAAIADFKLSEPFFIILPPKASAMKSFVQPKEVVIDGTGFKNLIGIKLGGNELSAEDQIDWNERSLMLKETNLQELTTKLRSQVLGMDSLPHWMRMRIHLGDISIKQIGGPSAPNTTFMNQFEKGKYSVKDISAMMRKSRYNVGTSLERKMDGTVALKLMKLIVASPEIWTPASHKDLTLETVSPKHTEVILVRLRDDTIVRVEAAVDCGLERSDIQLGTVALFQAKRRKRVEVTAVDVERETAWSLEVISDSSIERIPLELTKFIQGLITSRTSWETDILGLVYPGIALPTRKIADAAIVESVTLRSVYVYQLKGTGYRLEIAVYRLFDDGDTRNEPQVSTSVSMYDAEWEHLTAPTNEKRGWDHEMKCFFEFGVEKFMEDVSRVVEMISLVRKGKDGSR